MNQDDTLDFDVFSQSDLRYCTDQLISSDDIPAQICFGDLRDQDDDMDFDVISQIEIVDSEVNERAVVWMRVWEEGLLSSGRGSALQSLRHGRNLRRSVRRCRAKIAFHRVHKSLRQQLAGAQYPPS